MRGASRGAKSQPHAHACVPSEHASASAFRRSSRALKSRRGRKSVKEPVADFGISRDEEGMMDGGGRAGKGYLRSRTSAKRGRRR